MGLTLLRGPGSVNHRRVVSHIARRAPLSSATGRGRTRGPVTFRPGPVGHLVRPAPTGAPSRAVPPGPDPGQAGRDMPRTWWQAATSWVAGTAVPNRVPWP